MDIQDQDEAPQDEEMAAFVRSLHAVWVGQTWQAVEPFAKRAWHQLKNDRCWEEVRDSIRRTWVSE